MLRFKVNFALLLCLCFTVYRFQKLRTVTVGCHLIDTKSESPAKLIHYIASKRCDKLVNSHSKVSTKTTTTPYDVK